MLPLRDQIDIELRKFIASEIYDEWLNNPNSELNFKSPQELLNKGQYQPLWQLISCFANAEV